MARQATRVHFEIFTIPSFDKEGNSVTTHITACGVKEHVTTVNGKKYSNLSRFFSSTDTAKVDCKKCSKEVFNAFQPVISDKL